MGIPSAKMTVMVSEQLACIRIIGRANFTSSVDFKALADGLRQKGCKRLVLDLSECALMDSTFLGVLAQLGLKLSGGDAPDAERGVELFNPSPRIMELLETLGVIHLFRITRGDLTIPAGAQPVSMCPPSRASPR